MASSSVLHLNPWYFPLLDLSVLCVIFIHCMYLSCEHLGAFVLLKKDKFVMFTRIKLIRESEKSVWFDTCASSSVILVIWYRYLSINILIHSSIASQLLCISFKLILPIGVGVNSACLSDSGVQFWGLNIFKCNFICKWSLQSLIEKLLWNYWNPWCSFHCHSDYYTGSIFHGCFNCY